MVDFPSPINSSNDIVVGPSFSLGPDYIKVLPFSGVEDIGNDIIIIEPISIESYSKTPYQWALLYGYIGDSDTFYSQWLSTLNGGSSAGVFTDPTPTDVTVGNLLEDTTIQNKTWQEIVSLMVYQEKFPILVSPSFAVSNINGNIFEVNASVTLQFLLQYNMGSITPAYGTSGFRSGNIVKYMLGNTDIPFNSLSQQYNISVNLMQPFTLTYVFYAVRLIGPQPKSNKGNDYNTPYPAGDMVFYNVVSFVYPIYATVADISVTTKMTLQRHNSEFFECAMVMEDDLNNKQCFEVSTHHRTITGIKQFNTFSSTWEWINGSKVASLTTFSVTEITKIVNSVNINYLQYKHNGPTIGERKLRFYTT